MEPVNDEAVAVVEYQAEHSGDDLPFNAWDRVACCVNTIEHMNRPPPVEQIDRRPPTAGVKYKIFELLLRSHWHQSRR